MLTRFGANPAKRVTIDNVGVDELQTLRNSGSLFHFDKYRDGIFHALKESNDPDTFRYYVDHVIGRENVPLDTSIYGIRNIRTLKFMVEDLKVRPIDVNEVFDPTMNAFIFDQCDIYQYLTRLGYDIYQSLFISRSIQIGIADHAEGLNLQREVFEKITKYGISLEHITYDSPYYSKYFSGDLSFAWGEWTVLDVLLVYVLPVAVGFDDPDPEFLNLIRKQKAGYLLSVKRQSIQFLLDIDEFPMKKWLQKINRIIN